MTHHPPQSLADGYVKWLRGEVGHQLIYLVYATVVVFHEDGRILAQERYDFDWISAPGGAMELGESLLETGRREVREETGLEVAIEGLVGVYSHPRYNLHYPNGDDVQQWTACFWAEVSADTLQSGGSLRPDGGETLDLFFITPEDFYPRTHLSHVDMVRDSVQARAGSAPSLETAESFPPLQPYYPILRAQVGHAPVILPGATAIVEDEQGRFLMAHRADFDVWHFPGGFADLGETSTANLIREVQEETGLLVEPTAIVGLYSDPRTHHSRYPNGDAVHAVDLVLACRVTGGELQGEGGDDENLAVAFLTLAEIERGPMSDLSRRLLRDYLDRDHWPHLG